MSELSGLELRVAVGIAAGHIWKDEDDGQWKTTDRNGNHSIVDPATWLDHYESDIAAAWELLEKWREETGGKTSAATVQGGWIVVLRWGRQLEHVVRGSRLGFDASSAPTAICRALVAAAEKGR